MPNIISLPLRQHEGDLPNILGFNLSTGGVTLMIDGTAERGVVSPQGPPTDESQLDYNATVKFHIRGIVAGGNILNSNNPKTTVGFTPGADNTTTGMNSGTDTPLASSPFQKPFTDVGIWLDVTCGMVADGNVGFTGLTPRNEYTGDGRGTTVQVHNDPAHQALWAKYISVLTDPVTFRLLDASQNETRYRQTRCGLLIRVYAPISNKKRVINVEAWYFTHHWFNLYEDVGGGQYIRRQQDFHSGSVVGNPFIWQTQTQPSFVTRIPTTGGLIYPAFNVVPWKITTPPNGGQKQFSAP